MASHPPFGEARQKNLIRKVCFLASAFCVGFLPHIVSASDIFLFIYLFIYLSTDRIVQSLNSPFFPLHIGAEPGRAKEESRITCMRMIRTDQSKIAGPNHAARVNVSRNAFFSSGSERKHFL